MSNCYTKLTYTANGDYFIPNIAFSVAATENLGKYGRMRKKYLQEHRPGLFNRRGYCCGKLRHTCSGMTVIVMVIAESKITGNKYK